MFTIRTKLEMKTENYWLSNTEKPIAHRVSDRLGQPSFLHLTKKVTRANDRIRKFSSKISALDDVPKIIVDVFVDIESEG